MTTPNEIYNSSPTDMTMKLRLHKEQFPEIGKVIGEISFENNVKIIQKTHPIGYDEQYPPYDIYSLWWADFDYNEKPFLILKEYDERFITDVKLYKKAVKYIKSLYDEPSENPDICDIHDDIDFYPLIVKLYPNVF